MFSSDTFFNTRWDFKCVSGTITGVSRSVTEIWFSLPFVERWASRAERTFAAHWWIVAFLERDWRSDTQWSERPTYALSAIVSSSSIDSFSSKKDISARHSKQFNVFDVQPSCCSTYSTIGDQGNKPLIDAFDRECHPWHSSLRWVRLNTRTNGFLSMWIQDRWYYFDFLFSWSVERER